MQKLEPNKRSSFIAYLLTVDCNLYWTCTLQLAKRLISHTFENYPSSERHKSSLRLQTSGLKIKISNYKLKFESKHWSSMTNAMFVRACVRPRVRCRYLTRLPRLSWWWWRGAGHCWPCRTRNGFCRWLENRKRSARCCNPTCWQEQVWRVMVRNLW